MLINGIKRSLICTAVVLLVLSFMDGVTENDWESLYFQGGILLMGLLFSVWQIFLETMELTNYLLKMVVNFIVTLLLALVLGWNLGWYSSIANVGYVCVEVLIVFIVCYLLGITKTKKEVEQINGMIQKRKS